MSLGSGRRPKLREVVRDGHVEWPQVGPDDVLSECHGLLVGLARALDALRFANRINDLKCNEFAYRCHETPAWVELASRLNLEPKRM